MFLTFMILNCCRGVPQFGGLQSWLVLPLAFVVPLFTTVIFVAVFLKTWPEFGSSHLAGVSWLPVCASQLETVFL